MPVDCPTVETVKVGEDGTTVKAATPTPVKETVCGDPVAFDVIVKLPVCVPAAVGENVTTMVQSSFWRTVVLQLFVWANWPDVVTDVTVSGALPTFITVSICWLDVEPIWTDPKSSLCEDNVTAGPVLTIASPVIGKIVCATAAFELKVRVP